MNFGEAIESLKEGKKLTRMGWNATGMWIVLMPRCIYRLITHNIHLKK